MTSIKKLFISNNEETVLNNVQIEVVEIYKTESKYSNSNKF